MNPKRPLFGLKKSDLPDNYPTVRTDKEVAEEWNRRNPNEQITESMASGRIMRATNKFRMRITAMRLTLDDFTKEE